VMAAIAFDDPKSFAVLVEKARAARPDRHAPAAKAA
jgi:large subunit ribosomal protein L20